MAYRIMDIVKPKSAGIKKAITMLKRGGVIVYPTDTAYALGGCYNKSAVRRRVMRIKQRRDPKFTIIAGSTAQAYAHFHFSRTAKKIAGTHWPGPLSIAVNTRYAVRVPNNNLARRLALGAGAPLIASSANLSGQPTPYSARRAIRYFMKQKNRPDLIIDAGRLPKRKPSVVVVLGEHDFTIIRRTNNRLEKELRRYYRIAPGKRSVVPT